jgi:hypothetical protein
MVTVGAVLGGDGVSTVNVTALDPVSDPLSVALAVMTCVPATRSAREKVPAAPMVPCRLDRRLGTPDRRGDPADET